MAPTSGPPMPISSRTRSGRWCWTASSTLPPTPAPTRVTGTSSVPTPTHSCAFSAIADRPRHCRSSSTECAAAGPDYCAFAAESADATRAKFDALTERLLVAPMIVQGPAGTLTVTYSLVVETVRGSLYAAPLWSGLGQGLQRLEEGDAVGFLEATHSLGGPPPTHLPQRPGGDARQQLCRCRQSPRSRHVRRDGRAC